MEKHSKVRYLGWGFVTAVVLNCLVALIIGSPNYALISSMLIAYLPFFIFPFRSVFTGKPFIRSAIVGWESFFLCQLIYLFVSTAIDKLYPNQEAWGDFNAGGAMMVAILFGWIPGIIISGIAFIGKKIIDQDK